MTFSKIIPGTIVNNSLVILEPIGEGGMGVIYKGRQMGLDRVVAVKMLGVLASANQESQVRFKREAKLLASFNHKNIVAFYDFGIWMSQLPYIAMELLDGVGLDKLLKEPLPAARILYFLSQLADALAAIHEKGIIHRDLKPANVLVTGDPENEILKVLDFGLAGMIEPGASNSQSLTETGLLIGSISYMSPEQCQGKKVDVRSDIYSLGCIIYEMLCGRAPFVDDWPISLLQMHINNEPEDVPVEILRQGSEYESLAAIAQICLRKSPADRYQNIIALQSDLRKVLSGESLEQSLVQQGRSLINLPVKIMLTLLLLAGIAFFLLEREYVSITIAAIEGEYVKVRSDANSYQIALQESSKFIQQKNPRAAMLVLQSSRPFLSKDALPLLLKAKLFGNLASVYESLGVKSSALGSAVECVRELAKASELSSWDKLRAAKYVSVLESALGVLYRLHYAIDTEGFGEEHELARLHSYISVKDLPQVNLLLNKVIYQSLKLGRVSKSSLNLNLEWQLLLAMSYSRANMLKEADDTFKACLRHCLDAKHLGFLTTTIEDYAVFLKETGRSADMKSLDSYAEFAENEPIDIREPLTRMGLFIGLCEFYKTTGEADKEKRCLLEAARQFDVDTKSAKSQWLNFNRFSAFHAESLVKFRRMSQYAKELNMQKQIYNIVKHQLEYAIKTSPPESAAKYAAELRLEQPPN